MKQRQNVTSKPYKLQIKFYNDTGLAIHVKNIESFGDIDEHVRQAKKLMAEYGFKAEHCETERLKPFLTK
jgi:hypothetical protein